MTQAPNCTDLKPEGRALQAQQVMILTETRACTATRGPNWAPILRASALLEGEQKNLLAACSKQAVALPTGGPTQLPVNPYGMPNLGLPGAPAEADEGGGASDGQWCTPHMRVQLQLHPGTALQGPQGTQEPLRGTVH
ncbi:hypothetical protein BC826DRAFT_972828 [Russula brevipes]|nr:hypothetical protein BC826DRAFT_972828 [Russula brevipes]